MIDPAILISVVYTRDVSTRLIVHADARLHVYSRPPQNTDTLIDSER